MSDDFTIMYPDVEVIKFQDSTVKEIKDLLSRHGIKYDFMESPIAMSHDRTFYKLTFHIRQNSDILVLHLGERLVVFRTGVVLSLSEDSFNKLFKPKGSGNPWMSGG